MLTSIWLYRGVALAAAAAAVVFLGLNDVVPAITSALAGIVGGIMGACVRAYVVAGKRGVVVVVLAGVADFFGDFLSL